MRNRARLTGLAGPQILILAALSLRLISLTRNGLWVDEASSVAVSALTVPDIVAASKVDPHPPGYYLLLHGWTALLGRSEYAVRLLSVFAGVLSVAGTYLLAKVMFRERTARLAAWCVCLSPALIEYAQETRMYALLVLCSVILTWAAVRIVTRYANGITRFSRSAHLTYALVGVIGLYTQYYFMFVILAVNLWAFVKLSRAERWRDIGYWSLLQAATILPFGVWVPILLHQSQAFVFTWIGQPNATSVLNALSYLTLGQGNPSLGLVLGLALTGVVLSGLTVARLARDMQAVDAVLLVIWAIFPMAFSYFLSQSHPVFIDRQFLLSIPAIVLLMVGGLTDRRAVTIGALVFTIGVLPGLNRLYFENRKQEWRELVSYIQTHSEPTDLVYVNPAGGRVAVDYYLERSMAVDGYPPQFSLLLGGFHGERTTADNVNRLLTQLAGKHHRVWLIQFVASYWDPEQHLTRWLEGHMTLEETPTFRGLDVRLYEARP